MDDKFAFLIDLVLYVILACVCAVFISGAIWCVIQIWGAIL